MYLCAVALNHTGLEFVMHLTDTTSDSSTMCRRSVRGRWAAMPGGSSLFSERHPPPRAPISNPSGVVAWPRRPWSREHILVVGTVPRQIFPPSLCFTPCPSFYGEARRRHRTPHLMPAPSASPAQQRVGWRVVQRGNPRNKRETIFNASFESLLDIFVGVASRQSR